MRKRMKRGLRRRMKREEEYYECGYPVGHPPFPTCCTLIHGSVCQMELFERRRFDG